MTPLPHQPVLVGAGTCMQRADSADAHEPLDLMLQAVQRAGVDAGAAHALAQVQHIAVPQGRWKYRNPAGEIARALGADKAVTVLASVGVLQQSVIGEACRLIATGAIDSALVVGGDTGYRIQRARKEGLRAAERQQADAPAVHLEPQQELLHPAEMQAGIRMPVALYALLDAAWRAARGLGVDAHRDRMARTYQRFSEIAAANPQAWTRRHQSAAAIREGAPGNPMQAFPYTRAHCSDWNVDQAGALWLCSARKAEALGIPRSRWVYAQASSESNHMQPVSSRAELADCPGARLSAHAALEHAGITAADLDFVDLYSCFPIAVAMYAEALGLQDGHDLTITGGMPFAGGPFNNYALQATCRLAELIRERRRHTGQACAGLVSSVSGIMTKQGFGIWGGQPGVRGFGFLDVTAQAARAAQSKDVRYGYRGTGTVAAYTVIHDKGRPPRILALANVSDNARVLAWSQDPALVKRVESMEFCGAAIALEDHHFTCV